MGTPDRKEKVVKSSVCILDYGAGNVRSVANLFSSLAETVISNDPAELAKATHLVLPGVGAFGTAMEKIHGQLPMDALREQVFGKRKPFLGICVGMQVLADEGHEFGAHPGLGWLGGKVRRLDCQGLPLPHVGWNDLILCQPHPLLDGLGNSPDFYFVHSYAISDIPQEYVLAETDYGGRFPSVIGSQNILGVQFHPEKSQQAGKKLIANFLELK